MNARLLMVATIGALGVPAILDGCGPCVAAEPPPPFVPAFTPEQALSRFRQHPCAKGLADFEVGQPGLRAFQSPDKPVVFLDLDVVTPPSRLGVRYRTATSVGLDPDTGEIGNGTECTAQLTALHAAMTRAIAAAEASVEVQRFITDHAPAGRIRATYESHVLPRGRIRFDAGTTDGTRAPLIWE